MPDETQDQSPSATAVLDTLKTSVEDLSNNLNKRLNTIDTEIASVKSTIKVDDGLNLRYHTPMKAFRDPKLAHSFGMYILSLVDENEPKLRCAATAYASKYVNEHPEMYKAGQQLENTNTLGGNLVVEQTSNEIIRLVEMYGLFRQESRIIQMSSDEFSLPRRTGGVTASFFNEAGALPTGQVTWNRVKLVAKKAGVMTRWSSELNEDAIISIADYIAMEIAYAFSYLEDLCGFAGDGTSTYGGITGLANAATATTSILVAASGNTAIETIDVEDMLGVVAKLPLYARPGAKWYVSAYAFSELLQRLKIGLMFSGTNLGGGNDASVIEQGNGGSGFTYLGFPVVISQVLNATAGAQVNTQIAWLANIPLASKMGVRRGVQVQTSTERYFDTDELAIRGIERFDIVFHDQGAMVALKTPGS